jgi:hypothetical protein
MIIVVWNTFPDFCITSSILVTSSGINFQNTLQDVHSERTHTAVAYASHSQYIRPCQTAVGALKKWMMQR